MTAVEYVDGAITLGLDGIESMRPALVSVSCIGKPVWIAKKVGTLEAFGKKYNNVVGVSRRKDRKFRARNGKAAYTYIFGEREE